MIQFNRAKGESPKSHTDHKREIKYITRIKYYLKQTMGYFSSLYKSWVWFKLILTSFLKDVSNCYFLYLLFLLKGVIITSNTFESSTFPGTQCLAGSGTLEYLLNKSYIAKLQKKKNSSSVPGTMGNLRPNNRLMLVLSETVFYRVCIELGTVLWENLKVSLKVFQQNGLRHFSL